MSTSLLPLSTFIHVEFCRSTKETFNMLTVPKLPSTVKSKTPPVAWNCDILCIASSWLKRDVQVLYKAQYLWWRPQTLFRRYTTLLSRVHGSAQLSCVCVVSNVWCSCQILPVCFVLELCFGMRVVTYCCVSRSPLFIVQGLLTFCLRPKNAEPSISLPCSQVSPLGMWGDVRRVRECTEFGVQVKVKFPLTLHDLKFAEA